MSDSSIGRGRHAAATMVDLGATYKRLARLRSREELTAIYRDANRRGKERVRQQPHTAPDHPVAQLAAAIPPLTNLSVAINVLHVLPPVLDDELPHRLRVTIANNAAEGLHRCHLALELDGNTHGYTTDDWLPVVCEIAGPLLESARPDEEPPSLVRHTQGAVGWLSTSLVHVDQDSPETAAALADTLARLLVVCAFADAACTSSD